MPFGSRTDIFISFYFLQDRAIDSDCLSSSSNADLFVCSVNYVRVNQMSLGMPLLKIREELPIENEMGTPGYI